MPPYICSAGAPSASGDWLRGRVPHHGGMIGDRLRSRCREGNGAPDAGTAYAISFFCRGTKRSVLSVSDLMNRQEVRHPFPRRPSAKRRRRMRVGQCGERCVAGVAGAGIPAASYSPVQESSTACTSWTRREFTGTGMPCLRARETTEPLMKSISVRRLWVRS